MMQTMKEEREGGLLNYAGLSMLQLTSRREDDDASFALKSPEHSKNVIQNVKITREISYNT